MQMSKRLFKINITETTPHELILLRNGCRTFANQDLMRNYTNGMILIFFDVPLFSTKLTDSFLPEFYCGVVGILMETYMIDSAMRRGINVDLGLGYEYKFNINPGLREILPKNPRILVDISDLMGDNVRTIRI